jgi:hypothetical protein
METRRMETPLNRVVWHVRTRGWTTVYELIL